MTYPDPLSTAAIDSQAAISTGAIDAPAALSTEAITEPALAPPRPLPATELKKVTTIRLMGVDLIDRLNARWTEGDLDVLKLAYDRLDRDQDRIHGRAVSIIREGTAGGRPDRGVTHTFPLRADLDPGARQMGYFDTHVHLYDEAFNYKPDASLVQPGDFAPGMWVVIHEIAHVRLLTSGASGARSAFTKELQANESELYGSKPSGMHRQLQQIKDIIIEADSWLGDPVYSITGNPDEAAIGPSEIEERSAKTSADISKLPPLLAELRESIEEIKEERIRWIAESIRSNAEIYCQTAPEQGYLRNELLYFLYLASNFGWNTPYGKTNGSERYAETYALYMLSDPPDTVSDWDKIRQFFATITRRGLGEPFNESWYRMFPNAWRFPTA